MKVLFLSFYFQPDLSAGSFRATALTEALRARLPAGSQVDVLTTSPNRYKSFSEAAPIEQVDGAIHIRRIELPPTHKGVAGQMLAFLHYARQVRKTVADKRYDLVYATSSRLMTAALGAFIARRVGAPLYLDIRDLFVDTIADVLPPPMAIAARPAFSLLERRTFKAAAHINLVSAGFRDYATRVSEGVPLSFYTNGVDDEFLDFDPGSRTSAQPGPTRILYAGNIGEGQGLETIVPALAGKLGPAATLRIIGDGGRRSALANAVASLPNVEICPPVRRLELLEEYRQADVLFLHLNDYPAFLKVLPSKQFEYAATGKPILAGLNGFSADFARTEIANAAVFSPRDVDAAQRALEALSMTSVDRRPFIAKYARASIMSAMAQDMIEVANAGK